MSADSLKISLDNESIRSASESTAQSVPPPTPPQTKPEGRTGPRSAVKKSRQRRSSEWEILPGLKDGQRYDLGAPARQEGFLLKRRKWPLKGWHRRYFALDKGLLNYSKTAAEMVKGRVHGSVDVGLSVISTKESSMRIDIDAEEFIYHIKSKSKSQFNQWVSLLRQHRLYRQHEINFGQRVTTTIPTSLSSRAVVGLTTGSPSTSMIGQDGSMTPTAHNKVSNWIMGDSQTLHEDVSRLLTDFTMKLAELGSLIQLMELQAGPRSERSKAVAGLQRQLHVAQEENSALKARLQRIHQDADVSNFSNILSPPNTLSVSTGLRNTQSASNLLTSDSNNNRPSRIIGESRSGGATDIDDTNTEDETTTTEDETDEPTLVHQPIGNSKSYESCSVLSINEYFDAAERLSCSTESSEDDDDNASCATDLSDGVDNAQELKLNLPAGITGLTGRRSCLPAPKPDKGDVSLWSLLCKNIGKDLSKISMPVSLNEPIGMLQRLCEELEYCELLEKAASIRDPCDRLVHVAAFAASAYGSACHRAGHKPFNPLLGETYECIREDKGFRFISEQVSHHPPISACHAASDSFTFWQDMRIKTKFWGKSMEIIPFGNVHLQLNLKSESPMAQGPTVARYSWNKVTTCVHNLFKGQRWVDQYGEMIILDELEGFKCSLTFVKASYWSNKKHEVFGTIASRDGTVIEHLHGKWDEALYVGVAPKARCIWRPGAMPIDNQRYYGFSRFAIELNELTNELKEKLPPTDSRFRPDQRLLEEGDIKAAEAAKMRLEGLQREKRRLREEKSQEYEPKWFRREMINGEECWTFTGDYWRCREKRGMFGTLQFEDLWPADQFENPANNSQLPQPPAANTTNNN